MDAHQEPASVWDDFLAATRHRDEVRDEDYATVFREYHAELARLGAWTPATPVVVSPRPAPAPAAPGLRRRVRRLAAPVGRPLKRLLRA
jgi:hypothetical protein